jgi:hypothetical protein
MAQETAPQEEKRELTYEEKQEQKRKEKEQEERERLKPILQKTRDLFAKMQAASKGPASIDRSNTSKQAQWYRLRSWVTQLPGDAPYVKLRKLVVNSRDASGEFERDFFFMRGPSNTKDRLFFAYYVTTSGSGQERTTNEERLYFDDDGIPVRWQHNQDIPKTDGHALRWGEQARSDAKVAVALADETDPKARFVPITCVADASECLGDPHEEHCSADYALFPPPGLPVQKDICVAYATYADRSQSCEFTQKGRTLIVTESYDEACDGQCSPHGSETKKISLTPEMGRVVQCPVDRD